MSVKLHRMIIRVIVSYQRLLLRLIAFQKHLVTDLLADFDRIILEKAAVTADQMVTTAAEVIVLRIPSFDLTLEVIAEGNLSFVVVASDWPHLLLRICFLDSKAVVQQMIIANLQSCSCFATAFQLLDYLQRFQKAVIMVEVNRRVHLRLKLEAIQTCYSITEVGRTRLKHW